MYRLVLIVLAVIAGYAMLLGAFGVLFYTPPEMAATLVVAVASTLATSVVAGVVARVKVQHESSVITGLLLFFLFWPSLQAADLLAVAAAGVFAGLSKFLLAWRGRHLANPAAVGAVLVTMLGIGASVWWVAAGAMLPIVVLGAALVLYRTGRVGFALWFGVPAFLLSVLAQISLGTTFGDATLTAVNSMPIVFLAGFMLSEPLTQPPLRWQRTLVALVVAVLVVSPLVLSSAYAAIGLSMTPELALVIGNLIAFAFGQRRGVSLELRSRREVTPGVHEFTFEPSAPLRVQPGQYLELHVPHRSDARGPRRMFSVLSTPDEPQVRIATRVPEVRSSYKDALLDLAPGSALRVGSVGGDFLLPKDATEPLLLVAGGIGITPFVAQLSAAAGRDVTVVYAAPSAGDLAYLGAAAAVFPGVAVTPDEPAELPEGWRWVRGTAVSGPVLAEAVPDIDRRTVHVSGSPAMVAAVRRDAQALGARAVRTDAFAGY
jgi:ferredoxin-NADP reductase